MKRNDVMAGADILERLMRVEVAQREARSIGEAKVTLAISGHSLVELMVHGDTVRKMLRIEENVLCGQAWKLGITIEASDE
jgi:hypothetical protein